MNIEQNNTFKKISKIKDIACEYVGKRLKENGFDGLVPSHGEIIFLLCQKDRPIAINEIVKATNKPKSTLTSNLRTLKKYGYINRLSNPDDSRSCIIELSEKGKTLIPIFQEVFIDMEKTFFENVEDKDKELFENILDTIELNIHKL